MPNIKYDTKLLNELQICYTYLINNCTKLAKEFEVPTSSLTKYINTQHVEESYFLKTTNLEEIATELNLPKQTVERCWKLFNSLYPVSYEKLKYYKENTNYSVYKIAKLENTTASIIMNASNKYKISFRKYKTTKYQPFTPELKEITVKLYKYLKVPKEVIAIKLNLPIKLVSNYLTESNATKDIIFSKTHDTKKIANLLGLDVEIVEWSFNRFKEHFTLPFDEVYQLRVLEGKTYKEIAEVYGITKQGAYTNLRNMCIPPEDVTINYQTLNSRPKYLSFTPEEKEFIISELSQHSSFKSIYTQLHCSIEKLLRYVQSDEKLTKLYEQNRRVGNSKLNKRFSQEQLNTIYHEHFVNHRSIYSLAKEYDIKYSTLHDRIKLIAKDYTK